MRLPLLPGPARVALFACAALASLLPRLRAAEPDWDAVGREATQLLSDYLRINTSNPPGNEIAGAQFLRGVLEREGFTVKVWEPAAGKANLIARLPGTGRLRPVILLHHIDVVPASRAFWSVDPFGGEIKDGQVWGRGAIDTKGLGIAQLATLLTLRRQGVKLDRDILFVATSDEEIGGLLGAGDVARNHAAELGQAEFLLNEGSHIAIDANGRSQYVGVLAAEKAPFWLEVVARGLPGHGSVPREDSAPNRLVRTLERIRTWPQPLTVTPVVERFFRGIAPTVAPELQPLYADIRAAIADPAARARIERIPQHIALLRNTLSLTVLEGSNKTNVIPPQARAELDVRLLPGQDPEAFLAALRAHAAETGVDIRPLGIGWKPPESPLDNALFRAIGTVASRLEAGAPVVPTVSAGFTDNHYFMELGITCYGLAPFRLTEGERQGVHGNDERLSIANLQRGIRFLHELLVEIGRGDQPAAPLR